MTRRLGVVLVHGYMGSPGDFGGLVSRLGEEHGAGSVRVVTLPGHPFENAPPRFDKAAYAEVVLEAVAALQEGGKEVALIGHSTGGTLALSLILSGAVVPSLLVLAGTPRRVDTASLERWRRSSRGVAEVPLCSLSSLVSLINRTSVSKEPSGFPVLLLQGRNDDVVPPERPYSWDKEDFPAPCRRITIDGAGHDLFAGPQAALVQHLVMTALSEGLADPDDDDSEVLHQLVHIEPEVEHFLSESPGSKIAMARCPSGRVLKGLSVSLPPIVGAGPVFANIEITTDCNLKCVHCARQLKPSAGPQMMGRALFEYLLSVLPHAYRVTLVGLGEPLLHPDVARFVSIGAEYGRRMALVTNATMLSRGLSRELLKAGLGSIAFSIDAPDAELAAQLRPGTDLPDVIEKIRVFTEEAGAFPSVSRAVFASVSKQNVEHLDGLIDLVAILGVHVLVLTDLNFRENLHESLWQTAERETRRLVRSAVARGFAKGLPVLSVHALEAFGLFHQYRDFLLIPPDSLCTRPPLRTHCFSPWQTLPIAVDGKAALCDCRPEISLGDLKALPLNEIWNGKAIREHRFAMIGPTPPAECTICPRF